jgi:tetratricopeptide (TPR) repeat protein
MQNRLLPTLWLASSFAFLILADLGVANAAPTETDCIHRPAPDPGARIVACSELLAAGNLNSENTVNALAQRAAAYAQVGDFDRAYGDYTDAIKIDKRNARLYVLRSVVSVGREDPHAALSDLTIAIDLDPDDRRNYSLRAGVYARLDQTSNVISDLDRYIELSTHVDLEPRVYLERGRAYFSAKDFNNAIDDFTKAVELSNSSKESLMERANAFVELGQFNKAVEDYTEIVDAGRSVDFYVYFRRGYALMHLGDDDIALNDFSQAINLNPSFPATYLFRGSIYGDLGNFDAALRDFDNALSLGENAETFLRRGLVHAELGSLDLALKDINRAIELRPDFQEAISARAEIEHALKPKG